MGAYKDLRARTDDDVERMYDEAMGHTTSSLSLYRDELLRRESASREQELVRLTESIRILTVVAIAIAFLALAISVVAVIRP